jgi:hypothetical protein
MASPVDVKSSGLADLIVQSTAIDCIHGHFCSLMISKVHEGGSCTVASCLILDNPNLGDGAQGGEYVLQQIEDREHKSV